MKRQGVDRFRPELSPQQVEHLWQGMEGAARRRQMRRVIGAGVGTSAVVAAVMSVVLARSSEPKSLTAEGVSLAAGVTLPLSAGPIRFDEGSSIEALGSAQLEVVAHRPDRFVTLLVRGAIAVEVTPGGPRGWTVETDLASIEVVGTGFDVIRDDAGLEVRVRHGRVVVSGERVDGRIQRLSAGDVLRVPAAASPGATSRGAAPSERPTIADNGPVGTTTTTAQREPLTSSPVASPRAARARPASMSPPPSHAPAASGEQAAAEPAPSPSATPAAVPPEPTRSTEPAPIDDVLDRFVDLRADGASDSAEALLRAAIARTSDDAEAATLAFELGRWLSSRPGRRRDAVEALRLVDRPGAPPELVEAARALRAQIAAD
jgi:hypothetical protein